MFHTEKMQKIRIVGLRSKRARVVKELHKLGVIEIRKSKLEMEDDAPENTLPAISELVVRYTSALTILENYRKNGERELPYEKRLQPRPQELISLAKGVAAVDDTLLLDEKKTQLENEITRLDSEMGMASLFVGSGVDFSRLHAETLAFNAYVVSGKAYKAAKPALKELSENYEVIENRTRHGIAAIVAYDKNDLKATETLEHVAGVRKIEIPEPDFNSTAERVTESLGQLKAKLTRERREAITGLERHARADYLHMWSVLEMLSVEAERASASINFKKTDSTFVVEGWIQKAKLGMVEERMKDTTHGAFALEEIETDELAPTLMTRHGFLRPFDNLMEFFSLPRSDELDPTWIFILFFPVFYGLMVSDVGYGIASLFLAWFIAKKTEPDGLMNSVAKIWQICAIAIIFFGFLSNQYFGFGLNQYLIPWFTGFDWLKDTPLVLAITVLFGIAQVIVGLFFGFINSNSHGHKKLAIARLTSIAAIAAGTIAVSGALFGVFSGTVTEIAAALGVLSVLATIALSGMEATEVVSLISHPLSYARIMGFGLASVILALLIDKAFTPSLSAGILPFLLTSVIFILLHFVNMILGIFEGIVQGARLNFVEFFSKFYTGGGVKFKPFFYRRHYTKED